MSKYPEWWDSTITIFNKYKDPQTQVVTWYKTVLDNCFWKDTGVKVSIGDVMIDADGIVCRIPENESFKPFAEWVKLSRDIMANYFTLGIDDILVLGDVEDDINEYVSGQRSTDLINKYKSQGCCQIQKFNINTSTSMIQPHYMVRGA